MALKVKGCGGKAGCRFLKHLRPPNSTGAGRRGRHAHRNAGPRRHQAPEDAPRSWRRQSRWPEGHRPGPAGSIAAHLGRRRSRVRRAPARNSSRRSTARCTAARSARCCRAGAPGPPGRPVLSLEGPNAEAAGSPSRSNPVARQRADRRRRRTTKLFSPPRNLPHVEVHRRRRQPVIRWRATTGR